MKPLVAYLAYEPFKFEKLNKFIENYVFYNSGHEHDLLICFKGFKNSETISEWKKKIKISFIEFNDSNQPNDFDIGSFFRIAEKYKDRNIFFIGSHCLPIFNNWLKIFFNHFENKMLLGSHSSYASISSEFLSFYHHNYSKSQQLRWGIKHLFKFKLFPNPHVRTSAFLINAKDLLSCDFNRKKFIYKIETNYFESGRNSITNQLLKKGFKVGIVNSDNKYFSINEWKKSQTYSLDNQQKLIFSDNRTNIYFKANIDKKNIIRKNNWGSR